MISTGEGSGADDQNWRELRKWKNNDQDQIQNRKQEKVKNPRTQNQKKKWSTMKKDQKLNNNGNTKQTTDHDNLALQV